MRDTERGRHWIHPDDEEIDDRPAEGTWQPPVRRIPEDYSPVVAPRPNTFVPAIRVREVQMPTWSAPPVTVDAVWEPRTGQIAEIGTPVSRALATVIRAAPIMLLLLPITAAGAWALEARVWEWILICGGACVVAYLLTLWLDLAHNAPGSVERHRVNQAAALKRRELELAHELKRQALDAYLDHLDRS